MSPIELTRAQVLGYRAGVQHLEHPAEDPLRDGVLLAGVQDVPPGRTAAVALRVRGADVDPARLVLAQSLRAAPHLHRDSDVDTVAAALRTLETADLAKEQLGSLGDINFAWALGQVAEAMRTVTGDGRPRTKGELSTAVTELVDARLRPWCGSCGVHHVQDALFRYGTLQAGLAMAVEGAGFRYVPRPAGDAEPDAAASRAELIGRFLRLCGPSRPEDLARWLALRPAAARRMLDEAGDLVPVTVDGRQGWMRSADVDELRDSPSATAVRLLPPYDPVTELADRELLLPDRTRRAAVWRAVANPGVLLVRGEIAGIWRQRGTAKKLTVTVEPFDTVTAADRRAAAGHAETLAESAEVSVDVRFAPN